MTKILAVQALVLLASVCATQGKGLPFAEGLLGKSVTNCGETTLTAQGSQTKFLKSPGWTSGGYESNTDCTYILRLNANGDNHMRMKFTGLDMELDAGCNHDYVLIYDNISGKLMGKFCGTDARLSFITVPSTEARVVFHTDDENHARGFKLKFWKVNSYYAPGVTCVGADAMSGCITCGGTLSASSGTIQSLFYNDHNTDYPNMMSCEWSINTNSYQYLELSFEPLDLETNAQCIYDSVSVYAPGSNTALATLCGNHCSPTVVVPSSSATVIFTSDVSVTAGGFKLTYTLVQPGSGPSLECGCASGQGCLGNTATPGYTTPSQYTTTTTGTTTTSTTTTTTPAPTTPTTTLSPPTSRCSGQYTSSSGRILSPNYPQSYADNENCVNEITVPTGMHIQLTFNHFELEHHSRCNWDVFQVFVGSSNQPAHELCGSHSGTLTLTSNHAILILITDDSVTATGYDITYTAVSAGTDDGDDSGNGDDTDESGTCGGVLTSSSGLIQSPNFPDNYPSGVHCTWTVSVASDKVVQITKGTFHIEGNTGCTYDSLTYYDGISSSHSHQQKYCGTAFPETLVSSGNTVTFVFSSDGNIEYTGFSLSYTSVDPAEVDEEDDGDDTPTNPDDVSCGVVPNSRIVGGNDAGAHDYPWIIQLRSNGNFICGGTLVADQWVVTAAHCVVGSSASSLTVVAGIHTTSGSESSAQTHSVSQVISHSSYNDRSLVNDIALLKLTSAVTWNNEVRPACLSSVDPAVGDSCIISGWGDTELSNSLPSVLQEAVVPILDNDACDNSYASAGYDILDDMMCAGYFAGGVDTCQGDSGGPLVCENSGVFTLQGVTSWGAGCADANYPGVYTRVARYSSWISVNSGGNIPIGA